MKPGTYHNPIDGVQSELFSAMSSLNMEPKPVESDGPYLSDRDYWAKHSMEHMFAAMECLQRLNTLWYNLLIELEYHLNTHNISPTIEELKSWPNLRTPPEWVLEKLVDLRKLERKKCKENTTENLTENTTIQEN